MPRYVILIVLIVASLYQCGCQTTSVKPAPTPVNQIKDNLNNGGDPSARTYSPDEFLPGDPSAGRLQDIGGDLLLYYRLYHQMPQSLEDIKTIVGADSQPNLISPSGQPYIYAPGGLWIPKQDKCIMVYDPSLTPDGEHWCLLMPPSKPGGALSVNVVAIPEPVFRSYRPPGS
jgi:hypothetical protein